MGQRNDDKHDKLGGAGQLTDLEFASLRQAGYTGTISDMRHAKRLFELTEEEGQINDLDFRQLGVLGFLGSLADRFSAWWKSV